MGGLVAGIDEVGRGALAGPVVACAFWIDPKSVDQALLLQVNDSKLIPKKRREELAKKLSFLSKECVKYSIGTASATEIDEINILQATMVAMKRAYEGMSILVDKVIVDGNKTPNVPCPSLAVIGGDRISISIAAASIIAKVYRDSLMEQLSTEFPQYGWYRNAGYGTKEHRTAIHKFGLSKYHRRSFNVSGSD
ncbi:MAG: ribonuclease HII [Holosporales bacterium]|jgi:ribonuclease HII|nr:ribonuclease HII [Holosporales bacterium]